MVCTQNPDDQCELIKETVEKWYTRQLFEIQSSHLSVKTQNLTSIQWEDTHIEVINHG